MNDEFDRQLRDTFAQRAEHAPPVDLADASMQKAGGIRRRRRILSGVAVLAAAAFVVPVSAHVIGDDSASRTASKPIDDKPAPADPVDVTISGLERGPKPSVPYIEASKFYPTTGPNDVLGVNSPAIDALQVGDGAVAWSLDTMTGQNSYSTTDASLDLPQGKSVTSPTVNLETHEAAWSVTRSAESDGKSDIFVLADTDQGTITSVPVNTGEIRQVMGVYDGQVIFNGGSGKDRFVAQADASSVGSAGLIPWTDATAVTAVSSDLTRMAGQTEDMVGADRACSAMYNATSEQEEWRSCEWRPVEFSADGSLVLAIRPTAEGLGPRELAVLDADDGAVRQIFTTAGTFGRATFEGNESVDTVLAIGDQAAIVRCSIDEGECETATEPADVIPDDPASQTYPYQLTAN